MEFRRRGFNAFEPGTIRRICCVPRHKGTSTKDIYDTEAEEVEVAMAEGESTDWGESHRVEQ